MSEDSKHSKSHGEFDWNTEENEAIQAATEDARRRGLDSLEELLDTRSPYAEKLVALAQETDPDSPDITPFVLGVITERNGDHWLFFKPTDHIYEGADAIGIKTNDPALADVEREAAEINCDIWQIIEKKPLLIRSMYGAIFGFKREKQGIYCDVIYEGDDGWT